MPGFLAHAQNVYTVTEYCGNGIVCLFCDTLVFLYFRATVHPFTGWKNNCVNDNYSKTKNAPHFAKLLERI